MPQTPTTRQHSRGNESSSLKSGPGYGSLAGLEREKSSKKFHKDDPEKKPLLSEPAKANPSNDPEPNRPPTYKSRLQNRTPSTTGTLEQKYSLKEGEARSEEGSDDKRETRVKKAERARFFVESRGCRWLTKYYCKTPQWQ